MASGLSKRQRLCVILLCVVVVACVVTRFLRVKEAVKTAARRAVEIVVTVLVLRIIHWIWYRACRHRRPKQLALEQVLLSCPDRRKADGNGTEDCEHTAAKQGAFASGRSSARGRLAESRSSAVETIAVLGSGGHTDEMLHLLRDFNPSVYRIHFVLAGSDKRSLHRLAASRIGKKCEEAAALSNKGSRANDPGPSGIFVEKEDEAEPAASDSPAVAYSVTRIPRSREVGQSWLTTPVSFLRAFLSCLAVIWTKKPRLVLLNGPGTCVPIAYAALLRELLTGEKVVLVYVESVCRVENLSLSGYFLYPFVDKVFVQWPQLQRRYPQCKYCGLLY